MNYYKCVVILWFVVLTTAVSASDTCEELNQYIPSMKNATTHCFDDYVAVVDSESGAPLIVVYAVERDDQMTTHFTRNQSLGNDKQAINRQSQAHGHGMDFGHLASEKLSGRANAQRFYSQNRVAMHPAINREHGVWSELESYEVEQASKIGRLVVIAGASNSQIPESFYKIYIQPDIMAVNALSVPNQNIAHNTVSLYMTTIACIESYAGFDFPSDVISPKVKHSRAFSMSLFTQGGTKESYVGVT